MEGLYWNEVVILLSLLSMECQTLLIFFIEYIFRETNQFGKGKGEKRNMSPAVPSTGSRVIPSLNTSPDVLCTTQITEGREKRGLPLKGKVLHDCTFGRYYCGFISNREQTFITTTKTIRSIRAWNWTLGTTRSRC